MTAPGREERACRLAALRRFAVAITALNVLGHTVLGFEQSWAQPLVALATAYSMEILLETLNARADRRRPQYVGGFGTLVDFLLSAHITGLACAMLLYANEQLWPIAFAVAFAISSKVVFRAPIGRGTRHFLNPSNSGIAITLLLFPWVGIAPPYQFTENVRGIGDWILPAVIVCSGTLLNWCYTGKMPLILGWLGAFFMQAWLRSTFFGTPLLAGLVPMTGVAFLLFTFYMATDPATTPTKPGRQVLFGASVAAAYAVLMMFHVVFGLFFALVIVCQIRGVGLYLIAAFRRPEAPATLVVSKKLVVLEEVEVGVNGVARQPAGMPAMIGKSAPSS